MPLRLMNENIAKEFETVGVSVHSADEAVLAEKMGATYVTAGHIFATDCKKGLEPRGIEFLKMQYRPSILMFTVSAVFRPKISAKYRIPAQRAVV